MVGRSSVVDEQVGYTVSAVARRLGVAAGTLRTWDRRYGVSPSLRTVGAHRRYTAEDVAMLERMQSFMVSGMPCADAARAARSNGAGPAAKRSLEATSPLAPRAGSPPEPAPPSAGALQARTPASLLSPVPGPLDRGSDDRNGEPGGAGKPKGLLQQRGLMRAAMALDPAAASDIIGRSIERNGVAWTWGEVVAPVLRAIGVKHATGRERDSRIDIEHHLSHVIIRELIGRTEFRDPVNRRPVLLAAAPDEEHTLPLFALAAALAERSIATRMLGGRTPDEALAAAVRRTGPLAVFIWAHAVPSTDLAAAVPATRPMTAVVVGGPGWSGTDLPDCAAYPQDLVEAVTILTAVARATRV